jgi:monovalent cation:H+ antiporter-2, CPA2 family
VLATVGISTGSIDHELYSLILTTAILTMILTPIVSSQTGRIYSLKKRLFKHERLETMNIPDDGLRDHVVIAGGGRVGSQIASVLRHLSLPLVVVELDHVRVKKTKSLGIPVVYGDASHEIVLEAAEICTARLLVITTPDVVVARSIIASARRCNDKIEVVARTSDSSFLPVFKELGVGSVVLPEFEAALEMTRQSLLHLQIPVPEIQRRTESLRHDLLAPFFDDGDDYRTLAQLRAAEAQFDLQWVLMCEKSPLLGRSIGDIEVRKNTGVSIVGVIRDEKLTTNPDAEFLFHPNDLVAIIGTDEERKSFRALSSTAIEMMPVEQACSAPGKSTPA